MLQHLPIVERLINFETGQGAQKGMSPVQVYSRDICGVQVNLMLKIIRRPVYYFNMLPVIWAEMNYVCPINPVCIFYFHLATVG